MTGFREGARFLSPLFLRERPEGAPLLYLFDLVVAEHPDMGWQRDKICVGEVLRVCFVGGDCPS
jgi:hypothetical protein